MNEERHDPQKMKVLRTGDSPSDADSMVSAAVIIIGDEILSGRTQDVNLNYIANWLAELGIQILEARVVPDVEDKIVEAVNTLRKEYDYVFTTGGIGPTHDDITADAIGKAFGLEVDFNDEAMAVLATHYKTADEFNDARKRMARTPVGATLIDNPVSKAPGFQVENVFVLAGIPRINQAMLESLRHRLVGGAKVITRSVAAGLPEGAVANGLAKIQEDCPGVSIGSYPYYKSMTYGTMLVVRSSDDAALTKAYDAVLALIRKLGVEPIIEDEPPC